MISLLSAWVRAKLAGHPIKLSSLWAMHSRKSPVPWITDVYICGKVAEEDIAAEDLESHFIAGGRIEEVVLAMIVARTYGDPLEFSEACKVDLLMQASEPPVSLLETIRELAKSGNYTRSKLLSALNSTEGTAESDRNGD